MRVVAMLVGAACVVVWLVLLGTTGNLANIESRTWSGLPDFKEPPTDDPTAQVRPVWKDLPGGPPPPGVAPARAAAKYPRETEWVDANWRQYITFSHRKSAERKDHVEQRLWDSTRVDILTHIEAIEVDWAYKWAEAIGQSLYYAQLTNRKPVIVLLVKDLTKERRYVYRCQTVCTKLGIRLHVEWVKPKE